MTDRGWEDVLLRFLEFIQEDMGLEFCEFSYLTEGYEIVGVKDADLINRFLDKERA